MPVPRHHLLGLIGLLLCGHLSAQSTTPSRRIVGALAAISELDGVGDDLTNPYGFIAHPCGLALIDNGVTVKAYSSRTGERCWQSGRQGNGPGEFIGLVSIALTRDGRILVADAQSRRLNWLSNDGRFLTSVATKEQPHRVMPLAGDTLLLSAWRDSLLVRYVGGARLSAVRLPPSLALLDTLFMGNEILLTAGPSRSTLGVLSWTGSLLQLDSTGRIQRTHPGLVGGAFPALRVEQRKLPNGRMATVTRFANDARQPIGAITADTRHLYILSAKGKGAPLLVDVHLATTLEYRCTLTAPSALRGFVATKDGLIGYLNDPEPGLWRMARSRDQTAADDPCL